jgi:protein-S-isoprenylcysteine O-methyltransferase Ste14
MNPNLLISIYGIMLVSHGAFLIAHPHRMRSDPKDAPRDRKGFRELTGLTIALQLTLQGVFSWRAIFPNTELAGWIRIGGTQVTTALLLIGFILFIVGGLIRVVAIRQLGRFFTFEIGIRDNHRVIQTGLYSRIRHPGYSGYLLLLLGLCLAHASLLYALIVFIPAISFYRARIFDEERMLLDQFDDEYRSYVKRTWALIPYVY